MTNARVRAVCCLWGNRCCLRTPGSTCLLYTSSGTVAKRVQPSRLGLRCTRILSGLRPLHGGCLLYTSAFVSVIGLSFISELFLVKIDWPLAAQGWVTPSFPHGSMLSIMSVLGAVVMQMCIRDRTRGGKRLATFGIVTKKLHASTSCSEMCIRDSTHPCAASGQSIFTRNSS